MPRSSLSDRRLFLLALALHLVVLGAAAAAYRAEGHAHLLRRFDARWYVQAATHGWPDAVPAAGGRIRQSTLAFFPLFPAAGRAVAEVTRLPPDVALTTLSLVAGALAAVVIRRVALVYCPPAVATGAALAWTLAPLAVITAIAYSEALYVLLAAGVLLAVLRERWWAAAGLSLLAALTRPTGVLLAIVPLAGLVTALRQRRRPPAGVPAAVAGPVVGFAGWLAVLRWRTGRWDAWQVTEREAWHAQVDYGRTQVVFLARLALHPTPASLATLAVVVLYLGLSVAVLAGEAPAAVKLYTLAVVLSIGLARKEIPRYLLPDFPAAVPLAAVLVPWIGPRAVARVATVVLALAACAAAGVFVLVLNDEPP